MSNTSPIRPGASVTTHSARDTERWGECLAAELAAGAVVALHGELGTGKTCLVKGIARGLGVPGEITSPTFTLIQEHPGGRFPLYHVDLYRLDTMAQVIEIGLEEYLGGDGVTVIEWAEKAGPLLPPDTIHLRLVLVDDNTRCLERT